MCSSRYPVLIQGETSVGKTSLVNWLAAASGNTCVRINNHEHTDLQEYVGCYAADETGKLVFKEGEASGGFTYIENKGIQNKLDLPFRFYIV